MFYPITILIHTGLGMLFMISGGSKFCHTWSVRRMVANYRLVPRPLLPLFAGMLGPTELITGILLLASLWLPIHRLAWSLATGLLIVFTVAVASALARGLEITCGCGALLNGHVITRATLARNVALLSLLALDFWIHKPFHLSRG